MHVQTLFEMNEKYVNLIGVILLLAFGFGILNLGCDISFSLCD